MAQGNDFSKGEPWRIITRQAVPLIIAQAVHVLYNVVDRVYLGHLPGASSLALTGVGLIFPIVALVTACCNLFASGGTPLCAMARGAGDPERAQRILGNTFVMLLGMSAVVTALGYGFRRPILYLFGASEETYAYADEYLTVYLAGTVFAMISTGMNGFINAQGFPKMGMATVVLGAMLNVALDPVFIFVFQMGVRGAALATVISQGASAFWVLKFLTGPRALVKLRLPAMRLELPLIRKITALGLSGFIMAGTNCLVQAACNATLSVFGGDMYIGIMTVINSVREIFTIPTQGLTQGAQPVISFNYGAREYGRVRRSILFITLVGVGISLVSWALVLLFPRQILAIFSSDSALVAQGTGCMQLYFFGFFLMSLQFAGQSTFVALGRSKQAIFFSLLRKAVIVFPLTLLLPRLWGLGSWGVFLAEPISNLLGGVSCFVTMMLTVWPALRERVVSDER